MSNKRKIQVCVQLVVWLGLSLGLLSCQQPAPSDEPQEQGAFALHSSAVRVLTTAQFQSEVLDYRRMREDQEAAVIKLTRPAVIDYYAEWCEPCRDSSPMFDRLALQFTDYADFYRVDVDADPELMEITGQTSIPLFLFLWPSGAATFRVGFGEHTEAELTELIERYIVQGEDLIPPAAGA